MSALEKLAAIHVGAACSECGKPATCFGRYESMPVAKPACDDCCGHACEDGRCVPLPTSPPTQEVTRG